MTEPRDRSQLPAAPSEPARTPAAPERRSTLPAAPPERRTTEIDKQRVPMAAKPYRLLALVKQDAVVRVQKEPDDTVMTWPHLLSIEFFAAAMMSIFLLFMGLFINAPLEELANPNVTPEVAKAPWYFVGLQELLAYFHPTVAGVLAPTVILVGAALDPVHRPRDHGRRRLDHARPTARSRSCSSRSSGAPGSPSPSWAPSSAAPATPGRLPWDGFYFAL